MYGNTNGDYHLVIYITADAGAPNSTGREKVYLYAGANLTPINILATADLQPRRNSAFLFITTSAANPTRLQYAIYKL